MMGSVNIALNSRVRACVRHHCRGSACVKLMSRLSEAANRPAEYNSGQQPVCVQSLSSKAPISPAAFPPFSVKTTLFRPTTNCVELCCPAMATGRTMGAETPAVVRSPTRPTG